MGPLSRWSLAGVLALVACGGDERPWQFDAAEYVRELPMLDEVPIIRMTREEFAAQAEANAQEIDPATLQYYADTYGRLGFFDRDLDLRPVFAGSSSDWVGATYSPSRKLITLVGDAGDDVLVHEAVHAIQDQNFDIGAYDLDSSDGFLARRAVVEGEATMAQYRFFGEYMSAPAFGLDGWDWADVFDRRRGFGDDILAQAVYPVVFLDYVSFVYSRGFEFCVANLVGATWEDPAADPAPYDWSQQDELYTQRPPASTRAILELAVGGRPPLVDLGLADVPGTLSDRLELVDWDRLGAWYVYLLLYPLRAEVDAAGLAAAWRNDRVLFLRDLDTGATSILWTSEWASEDQADAVAAAVWTLYGRTPIKGDPPFLGLADDGELVHIERRGTRLVVARNIDIELLDLLVEGSLAGAAPAALRRSPSLPAFIERHRRTL